MLCQILREVVSSAAEAEVAGVYHNGREACPLRTCLEELGHPQPPTPIQTDNSTAAGIANDTETKTIQSYRHAFLLDSRPCPTRPISHLLEMR
jgi:hypothetical protein